MDETVQRILGAIDAMSSKLDSLQTAAHELTTDTASRLATVEEWRTSVDANIKDTKAELEKIRTEIKAENEKLTKALTELSEAKGEAKLRDKILGFLGTLGISTLVGLAVHYLWK